MKITKRLAITFGTIFAFTVACTTSSIGYVDSIEIIVKDAKNYEPIPDAEVIVVGKSGCQIATLRTNAVGRAYIRRNGSIPDSAVYVLARKFPYFLTGTEWDPHASEIYILMDVRPVG